MARNKEGRWVWTVHGVGCGQFMALGVDSSWRWVWTVHGVGCGQFMALGVDSSWFRHVRIALVYLDKIE